MLRYGVITSRNGYGQNCVTSLETDCQETAFTYADKVKGEVFDSKLNRIIPPFAKGKPDFYFQSDQFWIELYSHGF